MKSLDNPLILELAKANIKPIILVSIDFEDNPVFLTDAFIDINWNNQKFFATGGLVAVGDIEESKDLIVSTISISLSGIKNNAIYTLIAKKYLDREVVVYFAALKDDNTLAGNPFVYFKGRMDEPIINDDPNKNTMITIKAANVWVDFSRKTGRFFNQTTQQLYYPGDDGFEYCSQNRKNLVWGR